MTLLDLDDFWRSWAISSEALGTASCRTGTAFGRDKGTTGALVSSAFGFSAVASWTSACHCREASLSGELTAALTLEGVHGEVPRPWIGNCTECGLACACKACTACTARASDLGVELQTPVIALVLVDPSGVLMVCTVPGRKGGSSFGLRVHGRIPALRCVSSSSVMGSGAFSVVWMAIFGDPSLYIAG